MPGNQTGNIFCGSGPILFVIYYLLFIIIIALFIIYYLLVIIYYLLFIDLFINKLLSLNHLSVISFLTAVVFILLLSLFA